MTEIDKLSIATIRSLCIDMTNKAKSGHPGMPLGSTPILYTLFTKHLVANPHDPNWINRDRFVLSAGHASSMLYSFLHLGDYGLTIEDLKSFRQLGSLTPGHPEYKWTKGVDATSGPLGQGIAQAVGMALAERAIAAQYPEGNKLVNHYTYCLCGDGCLQEGLSQEAISFAGHQKLNKLILFYDSNKVTLDGALDLSFSEEVAKRFEASNWNVIKIADGQDIDAIDKAICTAKSSDKPTIIIVQTIIGYGSVNQGTNKVHGSPIGIDDGHHAKVDVYGFDHPDFFIPDEVYKEFKNTFIARGLKAYEDYNNVVEEYKIKYSKEYNIFKDCVDGNIDRFVDAFDAEFASADPVSTRTASGKVLNALMDVVPNMIGGSADVAGSVMTKLNNKVTFDSEHPEGRNINFGIREFAMASIQNGILCHGGLKTYVGSFFVFVDYMKAAVRMASLSKLPAIYLLSHDSIAVGEDGPTHQPIEQLVMLRSIPNINVIRPCDAKETLGAWKIALKSKETPTAIILSRQNLPILNGSDCEYVEKGAYIISKEKSKIDFIIVATGSEVALAIEAQQKLLAEGIDVRVISMPSWELFEKQSFSYKLAIMPLEKDKIASVEMLSTFGWDRYAQYHMGIDSFGVSAPAKDAMGHFNFTSDALVEFIKRILK